MATPYDTTSDRTASAAGEVVVFASRAHDVRAGLDPALAAVAVLLH